MSGYLPQIRYETDFEGDKVAIELIALNRKAFVRIMPMLEDARKVGETQAKQMAVYDVACEVLNEHITEVTGLRDKNGNAVSKDALLNSVYFVNLVIGTFNKLVEECSLGKTTSAGLEVKSPESTEAVPPTTSH